MSNHPKRRLLPCPFCGGDPKLEERAGWWTAGCEACGVETWLHESKHFARSVWNRRVTVAAGTPSPQAKPEAGSGPDYRGTKQSAP